MLGRVLTNSPRKRAQGYTMLDDKVIDAIKTVLSVYGEDEEHHYEECGQPAGHIYEHLLVLQDFILNRD